MKKIKLIKYLFLILPLFLLTLCLNAQEVSLKLESGKQINGKLLSITIDEVCIDPNGAVSLLSLKANDIITLTFVENGETLNFPITENQIPPKYIDIKQKTFSKGNSSYYNHYYDMYFFGGFSSKKTIDQIYIDLDGDYFTFPMIYKNGGLGGIGLEYLYDSPNNNLDYIIDMEVGLAGAKMLSEMFGEEVELLSGISMSCDVDFNLYPFNARSDKYPTPFVFAGVGFRLIGMEGASETHGALPFGIGFRWQIEDAIAIQLKERFVYSKLQDVDSFILPETRFEIHINLNKW